MLFREFLKMHKEIRGVVRTPRVARRTPRRVPNVHMMQMVPFGPPNLLYPIRIQVWDIVCGSHFPLKSIQSSGLKMVDKIVDEVLFDFRNTVVFLKEMGAEF